MTLAVDASARAAPQTQRPAVAQNPLLTAPILATLVHLSLPNMLAMVATALVAVAETVYVGYLGTPALAGMALVFPMVMLQQMMSGGAMGGGVSSATSRALGAGDVARAEAVALHAAVIGLAAGVVFTAVYLVGGAAIYRLLGGRNEALQSALAYSNIVFLGAAGVWLANTFASILRGTGNMRVPSVTMLTVAAAQIVLGGSLGLGVGPLPQLGMPGIALGQVLAYAGGALFQLYYLMSGRGRLRLDLRSLRLDRRVFADILRVGALACISPLQSVLTTLVVTRLIADIGTAALAGYGIGARLEFLLVPITFAIGVACVPMVGMAVGAGRIARARQVAWTGGVMSMVLVGACGLLVALLPDVWAGRFSTDPQVLAVARSYFAWAGPCYGLLGLGLCLYFASQGAGRVLGPVLAGTLRLVIVAAGGPWLIAQGGSAQGLFALIGAGMAAYGIATAVAVWRSRWGKTT